MQQALKTSCAAVAVSAVLCGHHQYTHSIPFMYQRASPYVVTIDSIGSKRDPFDVNGARVSLQTGVGSGFVVKPSMKMAPHVNQRRIVTNYHVIDDSEHILVRFGADGQDAITEASIESVDMFNDIAILNIENDDAMTGGLPLCDAPPTVGEDVFAIGSPYGLDHSLSVGVVSGVDRALSSSTPTGLIQTDAIINPGNSGGPLISRRNGCVLGMNTATINQGSGLGFAVPSTKIKQALID